MASTFAAQVFFPRATIRLFRDGIFVLVSEMETKHVRVARAVCTIKVAGVTRLLEGPSPAQEPSLGGHPPPLVGTGKTHTMLGMDTEPGIYLQTLSDLFQAIEETRDSTDCSVSMSYLEVSRPPPRLPCLRNGPDCDCKPPRVTPKSPWPVGNLRASETSLEMQSPRDR